MQHKNGISKRVEKLVQIEFLASNPWNIWEEQKKKMETDIHTHTINLAAS